MKRTAAGRRQRNLRLLVGAVLATQALYILAQTGSMALARHLWLADLASFIRLHLLIVGFALGFVGAVLPSRTTRLAAVISALAAIAPYLSLPPSAPDLGGVEFNV